MKSVGNLTTTTFLKLQGLVIHTTLFKIGVKDEGYQLWKQQIGVVETWKGFLFESN